MEAEVATILAMPRDVAAVRREAASMRKLIGEEKPAADMWDIKLAPGGLIDLEFIAQVAALTGQAPSETPLTATADLLANLAPGFADAPTRDRLVEAHALYSMLTQLIRLCLTGALDRKDVPPGLAEILARGADMPDLAVLEAHLVETERDVRRLFTGLMR